MSKTKITVNNNGSIRLEGDFEIVDKNEILMILAEEKWYQSVVAAFLKTNLFAMARIMDILNTTPLRLLCHQKNRIKISNKNKD